MPCKTGRATVTGQALSTSRDLDRSTALAAMRQGEADREWIEAHPEVLEPFRGQWVVVHQRQVVAHSADAWDAALRGSTDRYPGCLLIHVPTREEAAAVHVL